MRGGTSSRRFWCSDVLPFTAIVAMECTNVGLNTLFKAATLKGMNNLVFVVYSYAVAAALLLPFSLLSNRSRRLPPLTASIMSKIFLLGVIGCTSQMMGYTGIRFSSPTLASAISNLVPAFTFILAVSFRMEKLDLRSLSSQVKVTGTIVSILGAFVVTLYEGPRVIFGCSQRHRHLQSPQSNWMIGGGFLIVEYLLIPMWYIVQTQIMKEYPEELTVVFFYNLCVSILAGIVGLIAEPDKRKWRIGPDIALVSIICSGIFGSGLNNTVHTWALRLKGPFYVAMFKPLSIVIAIAMGVAILGDVLYLGSIVGATIIVMGFYTVMWGKAKEDLADFDEISDSREKIPLLQNYTSVDA